MATRVILAAMTALLTLSACTEGVERGTTSSPSGATSTPASANGSAGVSVSPGPEEIPTATRMVAPSRGSFLVRGAYPRTESRCVDHEQPKLLARYPGTLRVRRGDDGLLTLSVTLPFERYLEGIAEMPPSWPMAALEAQAVAARSYALASTGWTGEEGATLDEPICATASCQVYAGIPVPPDPTHRRWVRAVRRTAGRVLLHEGRPATTFYFSTSNGRTYGNEDVFGGEPLPYLRPVIERDDGASGTSRWSVRLPFRDLARFLSEAERWPPGRTIEAVRPLEGAVLVAGRNARREIALSDLRDAVNTWGPCLAPDRYPGALPLTIPSRWWTPSIDGRALVASGRGWGHGVGMVQWGAYGKARRGLSAERILASYYGGLVPQPYPEPGTIHVLVATGLTRISAIASRPGATVGGQALEDGRAVVVPTEDGISIRA